MAKKKETKKIKKAEKEVLADAELKTEEKVTVASKGKTKKVRGKKYQEARKKIEAGKKYPIAEAVRLAKETSISSFVGKLEAHLVVTDQSLNQEVDLPHYESEKKVAIFSDKIARDIQKGKIDFDVLLASPKDMPKIVPLARVLGPRGLMPNPKNGTLVEDPPKAAKKYQGGSIRVKTEKKQPVVHLVLGKLDQPEKELIANLQALIEALDSKKIRKLTLSATMGPGIKVEL